MANPIRGIYVPTIVPLDAKGEINEAELRRYVDWLIERGVHGLYPNGSTGEFTRFTAEERRRIIEIVVSQAAGRVQVLAGAAEANVRETLRACEHYAGLGVRAVAIVSPFYYRSSPGNVYAYFHEIARHSPVDITAYNIPMFASPIDVDTVRRLSEDCPRIVAIKDSSGDIAYMQRIIQAVRATRPDFAFLCGWDVSLVPMMLVGCDGGTNAVAGLAPELMRAMYDDVIAGRLPQALEKQSAVMRLFDPMILGPDFPDGVRVAIRLRGIQSGESRMPWSEEYRARLNALSASVQAELATLRLEPA
jgi:4-hydroxy-tetrahydrodipicolinate synthase